VLGLGACPQQTLILVWDWGHSTVSVLGTPLKASKSSWFFGFVLFYSMGV
jgi:hypothetical protein